MNVSLEHRDWSLHRQGPIDAARHQERVREAIRENLGAIIEEEAVYQIGDKGVVKIPFPNLVLPRFRFDPYKQDYVGQGTGDSKVGDILGPAGQDSGGNEGSAGTQPGTDIIELVDFSDIEDAIFKDLVLPDLQPKARQNVVSLGYRFDDVRKKGVMGNLAKRRTALENIKRNALAGDPKFQNLKNDDLRFRTWNPRDEIQEYSAVVVFMRDVSGSMDGFRKEASRRFCFWTTRFLQRKYDRVERVFLTHHTEAKEADEETFLRLDSTGGTKISSVYALALDIIRKRYPPRSWNIYPFHLTDSDNDITDNERSLVLVRELMDYSNRVGYEHVREGVNLPIGFLLSLSQITDPRLVRSTITKWNDIHPALKDYFSLLQSQEK